METIRNYLNGAFEPAQSRATLENVEPATGKVYSHLPDSDANDVDRAINAAQAAFPEWSQTPARERADIMLRIASLIERDLEALAWAESVDTGKPLSLARRVDIPRAASNMRFFAEAILHTTDEAHITDHKAINYTLRRPLGVVGCISPWNLPLYLLTWKIAPALATGNCVVGKPSEVTPMTAYRFSRLCEEAGLPAGVLNVVHGQGAKAGQALVERPEVRAISFTGGTSTGASIARAAAPHFKKLSLELGGKNPNIIFADADYADALDHACRSSFTNQGEICLCGSRILVESSIYGRFVEDLVARTRSLRVGDPLDAKTEQGAVVSRAHFDKVMRAIELAREEGGSILCGGSAVSDLPERCCEGYFIAPTVVTGLDQACETNRNEIFGPVVTVQPFDSEGEAIALANGTRYGLSATLWTSDVGRAHRVAEAVDAGIVWVNCWMLRDLRTPFGGMKDSGIGREGGSEALRFFTEPKNVCVRIDRCEARSDS